MILVAVPFFLECTDFIVFTRRHLARVSVIKLCNKDLKNDPRSLESKSRKRMSKSNEHPILVNLKKIS